MSLLGEAFDAVSILTDADSSVPVYGAARCNKKLLYRKEYSASVVLSWCTTVFYDIYREKIC